MVQLELFTKWYKTEHAAGFVECFHRLYLKLTRVKNIGSFTPSSHPQE